MSEMGSNWKMGNPFCRNMDLMTIPPQELNIPFGFSPARSVPVETFFNPNCSGYERTFHYSFLSMQLLFSSTRRLSKTTIRLSDKICTSPEAKGLEKGLHVGTFSVMIALVLEIEWSLWMFWKDSISWYYQKLLLTNSTIFRTRFQTPLAGTF